MSESRGILDLTSVARWLLLLYTLGVLAYLLPGAEMINVLTTIVLLPWFVGPAAIAGAMVSRSAPRPMAWAFLVGECAVIASTIWFYSMMYMHPDGQNGIAVAFLPGLQFIGVALYGAVTLFVGWLAGL